MADGTPIDDLQISIDVSAENANNAIDNLVKKLDKLQTSLSKVNGSQLTGIANGVQKLGNSMQVMNTIKTADFTRLSTNLTKLGNINVSALNSSASSLSHLSRAFNTLGNASQNAQSIVTMASSLSKLGGASVQRAITNIPLLAKSMNNLMVTLSKSPMVSQNIIDLTNALANLASQGSKISTTSKSIQSGLNKTNASVTRTSKNFGGLASAIGKFYATYFMVIRGIKGLYKSIESTADYLEAFNYFNVALGKIGSDWSHQFEQYGYESAEAYADSFSKRLQSSLKNLSGLQISVGADGNGLLTETGLKNLGLNIKEITQYASQLASVTNSVGQVGEVSLAAANSLTKLGADLSSLFNLDYSSVMNNLQSGLIGQSRALYKYGIDITNATLQTYAYELGLEKAVSEMTQAEKMQLRLIAILDQSKVSWGDLANTINSPSNMMRQFSNNLKEVGMVLGQLFIPLMQKVMPVINGMTIALKRLLVNIAGFLGIQLDLSSFGQGYSGLGEDIDGVTDAFEDATKSANKFKTVTLGIDELNINAPQDTRGTSTGGVGGGIDLTEEILKATSEYEKVWNDAFKNMENKAQEFADKIQKIFEPITAPIQNLMYHISRGEWDIAGNDVSNIAIGIFDLFTKAIDKVNWKNIGKEIGEFFKGLDWKEIISSAGNFLETALDAAGDLLEGAFDADPIATTIVTALGLAEFSGLDTTLKDKIISACPTNVSIGKTILITGITWEIGFDFGKKLASGFSDTEEEFQEIMNFTWFGENGFFKNAFSDLESSFDALGELYNKPLTGIFTSLLLGPMGTALGSFSSFLNNETVVSFGNWWNESVAPWFDKKRWTKLIGNIPLVFMQKWNEFISWWNKSGIKKWFEEKVAPWFDVKKWANLGNISIGSLISSIKNNIEENNPILNFSARETGNAIINGIYDSFEKGAPNLLKKSESISNDNLYSFKRKEKDFSTVGKNLIDSLRNGISLSENNLYEKRKLIADNTILPFNNLKNNFSIVGKNLINNLSKSMGESSRILYLNIQTIANNIKNPFDNLQEPFSNIGANLIGSLSNNMLSSANGLYSSCQNIIDNIKNIFSGASLGITIGANAIISNINIPQYAVGGFPEDGLFMANHNELVGQFTNGKTAVANNDQIVSGIKEGVREAVSEILAPYLADIARNTRETADKEWTTNFGDREIARANARGQRSLGYALIT